MKHRMLILLLFLLAGAVVNVAVAWGCAYLPADLPAGGIFVSGPDARLAYSHELELLDRCGVQLQNGKPVLVETYASFGVAYRDFHQSDEGDGGSMFVHTVLEDSRTGWPLKSMWCAWAYQQEWAALGVPKTGDRNDQRLLPLQPIWLGFAGNSLIYALAIWSFVVPFQLRRALRNRRNRCPSCNYDLRGADHAVCPECGK